MVPRKITALLCTHAHDGGVRGILWKLSARYVTLLFSPRYSEGAVDDLDSVTQPLGIAGLQVPSLVRALGFPGRLEGNSGTDSSCG